MEQLFFAVFRPRPRISIHSISDDSAAARAFNVNAVLYFHRRFILFDSRLLFFLKYLHVPLRNSTSPPDLMNAESVGAGFNAARAASTDLPGLRA